MQDAVNQYNTSLTLPAYAKIIINASSPSLSVSLVSPSNGATFTSSNIVLNARVDYGESLVQDANVYFYVYGGLIGSSTSDSSGSASYTISSLSVGAHNWYATALKSGYVSGNSSTWGFTYSPILSVSLVSPSNGAMLTSLPISLSARVNSGGNPVQGNGNLHKFQGMV